MCERYRTLSIHFGFETTLSGKTYFSLLKTLKAKGYSVRFFFLWVPDPDLSLARIKERVSLGGHNVPRGDVFMNLYYISGTCLIIQLPVRALFPGRMVKLQGILASQAL